MRSPSTFLVSSLLLALLSSGLRAQAIDRDPGDLSGGEEEQIRARREWLIRTRGLDSVARPAERRALALEETRAALRARGEIPSALVWQPLGPAPMTMLGWAMGDVAGRVDALAVHPTDENVLYLGAASGGVWKSIDGGANWTSVFDQVGTETIGAILVESADPTRVWVGTGEHAEDCYGYFGLGLFLSTDSGASWTPRNGTAPNALELSYISSILLDPDDAQTLLVGGHGYCDGGVLETGGLYRSTDAGDSWARVATIPSAVDDLLVDPSAHDTMYAAVGRSSSVVHGVYKSTDGGVTWAQIPLSAFSPAPTAVSRIRIAMAPSAPSTLYALMNNPGGTWLYKTTNGGASWTRTNAGACEGQCSYNLTLDVHPTDPATVLVGTIRFSRSPDSGATLTPLTSSWGSGQKVHQDTHLLRYSRLTPNRFWVGSDGGLWRTDNGDQPSGTIVFANLNTGLEITQFYDVALHPSDASTLFGGSQDNSSEGRFASSLWDVTTVTGDGFMNLVDPASPAIVFQTSYPSSSLPNIIRSSSGGVPGSFCWMGRTGITAGPFPWVTPLAIADSGPATPTYVFVASDRVYRADSAVGCSPTWTLISGDLAPSGSISVMDPSSIGTVRLYVGTEDGHLHRSDDATAALASFADVTGDYPGGYVSDVDADPLAPNRVFVTRSVFGGAKLYRSVTSGGSWTAVGSGLPDLPANAVAVDPTAPHRVFVGNDLGVYVSLDDGATFAPLLDGMPIGVPVTDLEIDDDPHVLVAGTYGRGAFRMDLDDAALFVDGFNAGSSGRWSETNP